MIHLYKHPEGFVILPSNIELTEGTVVWSRKSKGHPSVGFHGSWNPAVLKQYKRFVIL
jgi:hypothetical protein